MRRRFDTFFKCTYNVVTTAKITNFQHKTKYKKNSKKRKKS